MKAKKSKAKVFPDAATMKRVREKLSDDKFEGGNLALQADASETERAKYQLCQLIARYQREQEMSQRDIAKKLGVNEARISEIVRGKIGSFTLDRLIEYTAKLYPKVKVLITAA